MNSSTSFPVRVADRALDEPRAIVGLDDFHAFREAGLAVVGNLGFHRGDGLQRVLSRAHHDDPARDFAFAVELGDSAPQFRAHLDACHIAEAHGYARGPGAQRKLAEVVELLQVACRTHDIFGFRQLQH